MSRGGFIVFIGKDRFYGCRSGYTWMEVYWPPKEISEWDSILDYIQGILGLYLTFSASQYYAGSKYKNL